MKNKNYVYFFLSMCACTVHGQESAYEKYLLSVYDNSENDDDAFGDVISVKRSSVSKKSKNKQINNH